MDKDALIIQKLFKIAKNQQKILEKLAQSTNLTVKYLKDAAGVAALNTGIVANNIEVTTSQGMSGTTSGSNQLISVPESYIISFKGAPKNSKIRQKFIDTLAVQIQAQKPEISGHYSIQFED